MLGTWSGVRVVGVGPGQASGREELVVSRTIENWLRRDFKAPFFRPSDLQHLLRVPMA